MSTVSLEGLQRDHLAMSVARALALANEAAVAHGTEPADSLVSISEESWAAGRVWRIHVGPKSRFSDRYLHETLGLIRLQRPRTSPSSAKA